MQPIIQTLCNGARLFRRASGGTLLALLTLGFVASQVRAQQNPQPMADAQVQPLVPVQTNFSHSQHHWILWLPKHPLYEAIEVRSSDNPQAPNGKSVTVFFTERAGAKNQVYYFNEEALVKRSRMAAHYRNIEYRATGDLGKPLGLSVKFQDKDDRLVELTMQFESGRELSPQYAGLTSQSGHSADYIFLIFLREKTASMSSNKLLIGGEDFSLTPANDPPGARLLARSAYSSNIYAATIVYGKSSFQWKQNELTTAFQGRTFKKVAGAEKETIYRSNPAGDRSLIELVTNAQGELRQYKHQLNAHVFQIEFTPALPTIASVKAGQTIKYSITLDGFRNLIEGVMSVQKEADLVQFDWQHQTPAWTKDYLFTSSVKPTVGGGYDLQVGRKK